MSRSSYHPGLESWVINNDRPFPEITEYPGYPVQPELVEAVQPVLNRFDARFDAENPVPILAHFGENGQGFRAVVEHPKDIKASPGHLDHESHVYKNFHVFIHGAYITPVVEPATFVFSKRKLDIGNDYDQPRYQFGVCGGMGFVFSGFGADTEEGRDKLATKLEQDLDKLVVDREFSEMGLTDIQRRHMHWMGVILKGYYLQRDNLYDLTRKTWYSRAPEPEQLAKYRQELASDVPDSNSKELLPFVFALARRVIDLRLQEPKRVGEDYIKTDDYGRPIRPAANQA